MDASGSSAVVHRVKDGRSWRVGTDADVAWIADSTNPGYTIRSAIPPAFDAYGTIVVPDPDEGRAELDRWVLGMLAERSADQSWLLGYLDTGGDDVVFPDAPRVTLYAGWRYVLIEAGPQQAASWRSDGSSWRGLMPDLVFPTDRSWLLSTLWDDDWRCLGGRHDLVHSIIHAPLVEARTVRPDQDVTPPGHTSR